jgi:hypothetical protein
MLETALSMRGVGELDETIICITHTRELQSLDCPRRFPTYLRGVAVYSAWQVRLSVGDHDVHRVTTARARSLVTQAVTRRGGELRGWMTNPPTELTLVLQFPGQPPPDVREIANEIREVLGLPSSETRIDPVSNTEIDPLIDSFGFRGAPGRGRYCVICGGVDEHHTKECTAGHRRGKGSAS